MKTGNQDAAEGIWNKADEGQYSREEGWTVTALGYGTLVSVEKTNQGSTEFVIKLDPPVEMIPGQSVMITRVE